MPLDPTIARDIVDARICAPETPLDKARRHRDSANDYRGRLYYKLRGVEALFGHGVHAELDRLVEDLTEHANEAWHQYEQSIEATDRAHAEIVDAFKRKLAEEYEFQESYARGRDALRRQRDALIALPIVLWEALHCIDQALSYIESTTKRRGVRLPTWVKNQRKDLARFRQHLDAARSTCAEELQTDDWELS